MKCNPATESEIEYISKELENAKKNRENSSDFLDDFPFESTTWLNCKLSKADFGNLYLFWDGKAWEDHENTTPRTLKQGVIDFRQIYFESDQAYIKHLKEIVDLKRNIEISSFQNSEPFPILAGIDKDNPLLILDGNHRLSALWWVARDSDSSALDINSWIGYSQDMNNYSYYHRIPKN